MNNGLLDGVAEKTAKKHTVLIVHGTFSGHREGVEAWYAPGSDFCRELDAHLAEMGCPARCWAHLSECGEVLKQLGDRATPWFTWSGANSWVDRTEAADRLRRELRFLRDHDWEWHLVAHSHGGNVVLEAAAMDRTRSEPLGRLALMGTPMYAYSKRGLGRDNWQPKYRWIDEEARQPTLPAVAGREANRRRVLVGIIVSLGIWNLCANSLAAAFNISLSAVFPKTWFSMLGAVLLVLTLRFLIFWADSIMHMGFYQPVEKAVGQPSGSGAMLTATAAV